MKEHILVIDDDPDIRELMDYNLAKAGYRISCYASGEECLAHPLETQPDLLLLDLMLPGINGHEVCRRIRADAAWRQPGIIMITALGEEQDIVNGLELGADDYVVKPFSPKVLLARVASVLKRRGLKQDDMQAVLQLGGLRVDTERHEVLLAGNRLDLTATEFKLLHFLMRRPGCVFTRAQIIDAVHGDDYPVTDRSVDVQVVGLRRKLEDAGRHIETVRGVGYRFQEEA